MNPDILKRLEAAGIQAMAQGPNFCLFVRDGCIAMVPRSAGQTGFQKNGSSGFALDQGLAYLVDRDGNPTLVGSDFEVAATTQQVDQIRKFTADLQHALGLD